MLTISHEDVRAFTNSEFRFIPQEREGTLPEGVNACMNIGEPLKLNTNPEDSPETILWLFVYGTLKRGYWNHQRFCAQARSIEPAVVWGRLYHLHAGSRRSRCRKD